MLIPCDFALRFQSDSKPNCVHRKEDAAVQPCSQPNQEELVMRVWVPMGSPCPNFPLRPCRTSARSFSLRYNSWSLLYLIKDGFWRIPLRETICQVCTLFYFTLGPIHTLGPSTYTCSYVRWWTSYLRQTTDLKKYSQEMILGLIFNLNVLHPLPKDFNFFLSVFFKDGRCRGQWVAKNKTIQLLKMIPCSFKLWPFYPLVF